MFAQSVRWRKSSQINKICKKRTESWKVITFSTNFYHYVLRTIWICLSIYHHQSVRKICSLKFLIWMAIQHCKKKNRLYSNNLIIWFIWIPQSLGGMHWRGGWMLGWFWVLEFDPIDHTLLSSLLIAFRCLDAIRKVYLPVHSWTTRSSPVTLGWSGVRGGHSSTTSWLCYSRVAVMRGQVVTSQGLGIVGIRVSVDRDSRFGFTLTRAGGWWVLHLYYSLYVN